MSQLRLPLGLPESARDRISGQQIERPRGPPARTLGELAGDGGAAGRPAQIGPQPARADLRVEAAAVIFDDAERASEADIFHARNQAQQERSALC